MLFSIRGGDTGGGAPRSVKEESGESRGEGRGRGFGSVRTRGELEGRDNMQLEAEIVKTLGFQLFNCTYCYELGVGYNVSYALSGSTKFVATVSMCVIYVTMPTKMLQVGASAD